MDIYLFKPEEYQRLYNCSFYKVEQISLEKRQNIFLGISFILLFFIFESLYIPCLLAIRRHLEHSCYKIMFYMGINDCLCMFIPGLITGILGIYGAVFCSFPNLIFISGLFSCVFWFNETACAIILAINRCVQLSLPALAQHIFDGRKTWLLLLVPFFYGLLFGPTFKPVLFSGIFFSWFYNPHVGYADDFGTIYHNPLTNVNNAMVVTLFPTLYLLFLAILICKRRSMAAVTSASRTDKKIFIQVLLISTINISATTIYVYMQFFPINNYIIYFASLAWLLVHGLKPVIYLTLNVTIQQDVAKMFGWSCQKKQILPSSIGLTIERRVVAKKNTISAATGGMRGETM